MFTCNYKNVSSCHIFLSLYSTFIGFCYINCNVLTFCPQEATAEEVEFDDEEVGPEEVEDTKEYWVL